MVSVFYGELGRVVLPLAIIIHCHLDKCPYIQALWIILIHGPAAMLYGISPFLMKENTHEKNRMQFLSKKSNNFCKIQVTKIGI